jgi:hypothetical protein
MPGSWWPSSATPRQGTRSPRTWTDAPARHSSFMRGTLHARDQLQARTPAAMTEPLPSPRGRAQGQTGPSAQSAPHPARWHQRISWLNLARRFAPPVAARGEFPWAPLPDRPLSSARGATAPEKCKLEASDRVYVGMFGGEAHCLCLAHHPREHYVIKRASTRVAETSLYAPGSQSHRASRSSERRGRERLTRPPLVVLGASHTRRATVRPRGAIGWCAKD